MQKFIDINFFHPLSILCHKCCQTSEVPVEEGFLTQVKASDNHTQPAHLPLTPLFKRTEDALLPSHLGTASTGVHSWPLCTWPELDRDPVAHAETTGFRKEQSRLTLHCYPLGFSMEKEMAAHSSFLDWKIPWTAKPAGLPSMGLQRVGQDWATSLTRSLRLFQIILSCIYLQK